MKWYAMRVPSPVLTKAVAMKKAATTSHTTVLPKPAVASAIVSVPESTANAAATNATAPIGSGRRTMPTIMATKTASRCHARGCTPAGSGNEPDRGAHEHDDREPRCVDPRPPSGCLRRLDRGHGYWLYTSRRLPMRTTRTRTAASRMSQTTRQSPTRSGTPSGSCGNRAGSW